MTTREADAAIKSGKPVRVTAMGQTFDIVIVRGDRWSVYSERGGVFDRGDLKIVRDSERTDA